MTLHRAFAHRRVWRCAGLGVGLLAVLGSALLVFPHPVDASCGVTDPGACLNDVQYSLWATSAGMAWQFDSMLLALAYQLARLRYELVQTIFTSAYTVLTTFVSPLIIPTATLALTVGVIALFLVPVLGHTRVVNIRHVVVWALLAPLLLTQSGDVLVQLDTQRTTVAQDIFTQVGSATSVSPNVFGAQASDIPDPKPLYPAAPCRDGSTISRPPGSPAIGVDSLAAAVAWANAGDIWCPQDNDPSPTFPDAFTKAPPDGPGWALENGHPGDYEEPQSSTYVQGMQQGSTRLWLAIIPCVLAVLDALVQLLFSLAMVALWVGLPLALVTVFFQSTAAGVTLLARRVVSVFQVSWSCSILLGIVFIALSRAIQLHNVAAYVGFATGAIFLYTFVLWTAGSTLVEALQTLRTTIALATGLDAGAPVRQVQEIAGTAVGVGAAVATGGASVALAGGAAAFAGAAGLAQTGSGVYAASAAVGRVSPSLMQVGEVAAALGYADPQGEVVRGLEAGQMGAHTTQQMRRRMHEDAKLTDDEGQTYGQRAERRSIARTIERVPEASATSAVQYDPENGIQFVSPVPQRFADHAARSTTPVYREAEGDVDTVRLTQLGYTWQNDAGRVRFWQDGDVDQGGYGDGLEDTATNGTSAGTSAEPGTPLEQAAQRAAERVRLIEAGAIRDDLERATRLRDATQAAAQAQANAAQAETRAAAQAQARASAQAETRAAAQTVARAAAAAAGRAARQGTASTPSQERVEGMSPVMDAPELPQEREEVLPPIAADPSLERQEVLPPAATDSSPKQEVLPPIVADTAQAQQGVQPSAANESAQVQQGVPPSGAANASEVQEDVRASVVSQEPLQERQEVLPPVAPAPAAPTASTSVAPTTDQNASTSTITSAIATDVPPEDATATPDSLMEAGAVQSVTAQRVAVPAPPVQRVAVPDPPQTDASAPVAAPIASPDPVSPVEDA